MVKSKKKPSKNVRVQADVYEKLRKLAFKLRKPMGRVIEELLSV